MMVLILRMPGVNLIQSTFQMRIHNRKYGISSQLLKVLKMIKMHLVRH